MSEGFDPRQRLPRALHALASPPPGLAWNHAELADLLPTEGLRPAAVLLGLIERADGLHVLLTRRTEALRHHAGQVSFPGGRIEATDADPAAAALREAYEEVGLPRELVEPLGFLDPFATITGFHVFPLVAWVDAAFIARIDPSEVAEAFEVPLAFLLDPGNLRHHDMHYQGRSRQVLEFTYGGHRIWGATAAMLLNFRQRMERA